MKKHEARLQLRHAVKMGVIDKPERCEICESKTRLVAHHHDYDEPLDVKWVCAKCHSKIHRGCNVHTKNDNHKSRKNKVDRRYKTKYTIAFIKNDVIIRQFRVVFLEWIMEAAKKNLADKSGANGFASDAEIARELGISRMAIHNWRIGKNRPSDKNIAKMLAIAGINIQ